MTLLAVTGAMFIGSSTLCASEMDDRIESSAENSYVYKTFLKNDSIKINSEDGVVVLSGTVINTAHKELAEETVESLPGVVRVDNKLAVKEPPPAENSNEWMSLKVNTVLMFHRNVSAISTDVSVNNGVVTLSGEASSMAQKELTTEYARDVDGVKEVINNMTIAKNTTKAEKRENDIVDDASITAQIKILLVAHRSTSAINTSVQTNDGVVTITGIAKNGAERSLVSKIIRDVSGVKDVDNKMTIEVPKVTK